MNYVGLINLIPSPSMEGYGWNGSYSTYRAFVGRQSLLVNGMSGSPEAIVQTTESISLNPSHDYYVRVYGWQDTKTSGAAVGFYWPIAEPSFNDNIPIGDAGMWVPYSAVNNRTSFASGKYPLRIDFNNRGEAGTIYFDGCMLIDLTACFGEGNEPTKEWCDNNVPYFEGQIELSVYEVEEIEVVSVTIDPNPVMTGTDFKISVQAQETKLMFTPNQRYAGELYAREGGD